MTISPEALGFLTAGIQAEIAAYVFYRLGAEKIIFAGILVTLGPHAFLIDGHGSLSLWI